MPSDTPDTSRGGFFHALLRPVIEIRRDEVALTLWSAAYIFFVLCSYYMLRPLRDEISTADPENLQYLWTGTFFAMLAAVPVYAWVASRFPRRVFIPYVYRFFGLNLLLFAGALAFLPASIHLAIERVFYVWLSVFSLFVVTVFWQFMADVFRNEQGRRLFGFIAVGGSIGAVAGSALTGALVTRVGMVAIVVLAALVLELGVQCMRRVHRLSTGPASKPAPAAARVNAPTIETEAPVFGSVWQGLGIVFRSPYLVGICLYLFLHTFGASFLYYHQAYIVGEAIDDRDVRRALLANIDLVVNILAALGQCFATGRVVRWIGVGWTLTILPLITVVGYAVLAAALLAWPSGPNGELTAPVVGSFSVLLWALVIFQVMRRAGNFAFAKPAREILFTVVPRAQKYKSKAFIDTAVYRGGDLVSGYLFAGLKWTGLGLAGLAVLAVPVAAAWSAIGLRLGRRQDELADDRSKPCPRCGYDLRGSAGRCPECGLIEGADLAE